MAEEDTNPGTLSLNIDGEEILLSFEVEAYKQEIEEESLEEIAKITDDTVDNLRGSYFYPQFKLDRAGAQELHNRLNGFLGVKA
jgi:hypothetical protein